MCLSNLSAALRLQIGLSEALGTAGPSQRSQYAAEAIEAARAACASVPATHPDRARYLNGLSILLREYGSANDLDEAVTAAAGAAAGTPAGHQDWCPHMSNLGNASAARFTLSRRREDFTAAVGAWQKAAKSPTGESQVRLAAAIAWGRLAATENDTAEAADGFGYAVSLLPIVAWPGLERTTREENLARWGGLASDAAAWAIRKGEPERAVELLEQGRSVLWTQQLQLRTGLDRLEGNPGLKDELDRIRQVLDTPGRYRDVTGERSPADYELAAAARRRNAERWDTLIAQARGLLGQDFLAIAPFERLRDAAANGPVIILNTSSYGCDALAVDTSGVLPIPLPELDYDEITSRTGNMLAALREPGGTLNKTLADLLGWLWMTTARPVLDAVNITGPVDMSARHTTSPQRLWWCPTGLLSFLPLHAAGLYNHDLASVPERVISSYTSTLSLLIRARQPRKASDSKPLLVGVPDAPGAARLGKVPEEINQTRETLTTNAGLSTATVLEGPAATRTRVLREMASHNWVHFACHGLQNVNDPAAGSIILSDGPLPILDIAALQLSNPDFAFLSACHTLTGVVPLADEAIHLASAFQVAGYRHVIATLWWISDLFAPDVAHSVYQTLCRNGIVNPDLAAEAIHLAIAEQRRAHPSQPGLWAAYAHTGP